MLCVYEVVAGKGLVQFMMRKIQMVGLINRVILSFLLKGRLFQGKRDLDQGLVNEDILRVCHSALQDSEVIVLMSCTALLNGLGTVNVCFSA